MAIVFSCPCGKEIRVADGAAGKRGKCPACGASLDIPASDPPPALASAPPTPPRAPDPPAGLGLWALRFVCGLSLLIVLFSEYPASLRRDRLDADRSVARYRDDLARLARIDRDQSMDDDHTARGRDASAVCFTVSLAALVILSRLDRKGVDR